MCCWQFQRMQTVSMRHLRRVFDKKELERCYLAVLFFSFTFFAGCDALILFVAGKIPECDLIAGESGVLCIGGNRYICF